MDPCGWVNVNELMPFLGKNVGIEDLRQWVIEDNKGRFILDESSEQVRVRACQGHSIQLETPILSPLSVSDAAFVFHGTTASAWEMIQSDGYLLPMNRVHVHFALCPERARSGRPILLILDVAKAIAAGVPLLLSTNSVVLCPERVPVSMLRFSLRA